MQNQKSVIQSFDGLSRNKKSAVVGRLLRDYINEPGNTQKLDTIIGMLLWDQIQIVQNIAQYVINHMLITPLLRSLFDLNPDLRKTTFFACIQASPSKVCVIQNIHSAHRNSCLQINLLRTCAHSCFPTRLLVTSIKPLKY